MSAIEHLTGEKTLPQGSGRTDAGVHANAQVASVTLESPIPAPNLCKALNHILPPAIRITHVEEAPPEFHARRSARAKTYCYRIFRAEICPPFMARYVYHYPYPLSEECMAGAAPVVIGEHDFTSFAAVDPEKNAENEKAPDRVAAGNVRTIFGSAWKREGDELVYTVRGAGFLHHMVRNLVGTFLMIGRGELGPDYLACIIAQRERSAAGPTAPASGLFLVSVEY